MNSDLYLREFENLATRLGIEIRRMENGPVGFCVIKGAKVLFIDSAMDKNGQIQVFIESLRTIDLSGVYVVPVLRQLLGVEENSD